MAARFDIWCPSTKCCALDVSCGHPGDRLSEVNESSRLPFLPVGDAGSDNEVPLDRPTRLPVKLLPRRTRLLQPSDGGERSGASEHTASRETSRQSLQQLPAVERDVPTEDIASARQPEDEQSPVASEPKARNPVRGVQAADLKACIENLKKDLRAELAETASALRAESRTAFEAAAAELRAEMRAVGEQLAGQDTLGELLARHRDEQSSMQDLDQALLVGVEKLAQGQDVMKRTMEIADLDRRVAALERAPPGVPEGQSMLCAEPLESPQALETQTAKLRETQVFMEHMEHSFRTEVDRVSEMHEARLSSLQGFLADHAEEHARTARQDARLRSELSRIHGDLRAHRMAIRAWQLGASTELLPDAGQTAQNEKETLKILEISEIPDTTAHYSISSPLARAPSEDAEDETTPCEVFSVQDKFTATSFQEMCLVNQANGTGFTDE